MSAHVFTLAGSWSGGLGGQGQLTAGTLTTPISAPAALGGAGVGSNPEELLLAAASTCYLITLAAICQRRELAVLGIALTSDVRVESNPPSLKVVAITHRPVITYRAGADASVEATTRGALLEAAQRAEQFCMINAALRGNVAVSVAPTITGG